MVSSVELRHGSLVILCNNSLANVNLVDDISKANLVRLRRCFGSVRTSAWPWLTHCVVSRWLSPASFLVSWSKTLAAYFAWSEFSTVFEKKLLHNAIIARRDVAIMSFATGVCSDAQKTPTPTLQMKCFMKKWRPNLDNAAANRPKPAQVGVSCWLIGVWLTDSLSATSIVRSISYSSPLKLRACTRKLFTAVALQWATAIDRESLASGSKKRLIRRSFAGRSQHVQIWSRNTGKNDVWIFKSKGFHRPQIAVDFENSTWPLPIKRHWHYWLCRHTSCDLWELPPEDVHNGSHGNRLLRLAANCDVIPLATSHCKFGFLLQGGVLAHLSWECCENKC